MSSGPTSSSRLQELYLEAVELDGAGRARFVERLRGEDEELARHLARLLAAGEESPSPIDRPLAAAGAADRAAELEPEAPPPRQVGAYRLVRELGRGGMGRVFLAEQETPDFRRTVALKLIDAPPGEMRDRPPDGGDAVRRFRDEVRILAALDHPGIVRFHDGGSTPEGVWYLALEYVEGVDLLRHAEAAALGVEERVALVAAIAEAVAHAHARGIVHRDIKPGNVLVGADARPRLLDFGISKLLEPAGPEADGTTRGGPRLLTPAYASPEQLAGERATTASDVYSLGVVLYELLCGMRPEADATGAIVPPSRSARRATTATTRTGRIGRDLDAICLRALRARPAERYPDARALAADLGAYLATGSSAASRRGLRRLAAAALVAAGAGASWWTLARTPSPLPAPATHADWARPGFPFDPVNPPPLAESETRFVATPDDVVAGAAFAIGLGKAKRFDEAALVVARLRQIPGRELDPLVDYAEGRVAFQSQERQRALFLLTRARDAAIAQGRDAILGEILGLRGGTLSELGQREAAVAELERALAEAERTGDALFVYRRLNDLALEHLQRGDSDAGQALLERAVAAAARAGVRPLVALGNLAALHGARGRPDLAVVRLRELIDLRKLEPSRLREAQTWLKLFESERDLGELAASDAALEQALALLRPLGKERDLALALYFRAQADLDAARLDRIDSLLSGMREVAEATVDRRPLGLAKEVEARRHLLAGERDAARSAFAEARAMLVAQGDGDLATRVAFAAAAAELAAGDAGAAARVLDEARLDAATFADDDAGFFSRALRARIAALEGRRVDAAALLAELGDRVASGPSLSRRLAFLTARARLAALEGRFDAARADLESARDAARRSGRAVAAGEIERELARDGTRRPLPATTPPP